MTEKTKKRNWDLMIELIEYLQKNELYDMVYIYTNGRMYSSDPNKNAEQKTTRFGPFYDCGEITPSTKYNNPETITVTFEGSLYDAYNGYIHESTVEEDIQKICDKYGLYPEQGYAWDFSLYE